MLQRKDYVMNMLGSIPHQKFCFIIYLLEDEQELSLGMLIRLQRIYNFTRRVASICSLCAGTVYIVLCGSPTSSITLVSSLREMPTVAVLHHPFLFGEIPTLFKPHQLRGS